ncbi:Quinonprotein alcohol dehydrogenase-like-superfamily [Cynara cardunculus var. scolymus]|uniref:Quinonprotein alcohol dehydrogenase-like-superfamily n=1 Tax=Cynara cardunculus var. scolymus TaxID=59895 RepID=A0A118JUK5_CYNCS|nr:Quinonprotein alcohol dehydrogenase-like-superfamily [Cynara cardunculus var. scolymus]
MKAAVLVITTFALEWLGVPAVGAMSSLSRELVFLILQFLDEEKFKETVHKNDRAKAVEILVKDLKVFSTFNEELFKEITQLLTLDNFRQNEQLSKYGDTKSARSIMLVELKKLIEANPLFREKLAFPVFKASRLRTLINQSLNWQHQLCKNPRPNPDIKTLFTDHTCASNNGGRAPPPTNSSLAGPVPKAGVFPTIGAHGPFQPVVSPSAGAIAGWMATANPSMPHTAVAAGPPGLVQPPVAAAFLKHPRTPPGAPGLEYQMADSEHLMKRVRVGPSDEVSFSGSTHPPNIYSPDDLPKTVVRALNQGSNAMCMDFHPQQQTILLVGTNVGEISIWEVGSRERMVHKPFKVWDISACSMPFQTTLVKDAAVSVNRCIWGPDGSILGVAFSKHIVQIYTYNPSGELRQHLEIDAHVGGVNDIAFAHPNKQLCIVTCGDDKTIKVWDAVAGRRQYTFEGHEAPVYSVCPHYKEQIQFIFSTAIDGKIKAWLYDCLGSRVDYDAPGLWCTTMAYSADGTRLFSCGTSKEGEAHLVEWNESEGAIKREYSGFRKRSMGVVQFDTTRNRFLAAGDEFQIKFWDMDSINMLTVTDADDGLPARPRLRFNKEGSLLAVTTSDNGIKILANGDGLRMLRMLESRAYEGSRAFSDTVKPSIPGPLGPIPNASSSMASVVERDRMQTPLSIGNLANAESSKVVDIKPRIVDGADKIKSWKLPDIVDSSHLKPLRLPDPMAASKVMRLIYTNSGLALLALASSAIHKLWKWQRSERNPSGKSTASIVPQLWQPTNGALMSNDVSESKPAEESAACIALSKNDSYVMSASGGKVSLFNMMTFKLTDLAKLQVMTTFMPPPPAATYLAFHPQDNNIVAIGMEDSTIQIYNVRVDEPLTAASTPLQQPNFDSIQQQLHNLQLMASQLGYQLNPATSSRPQAYFESRSFNNNRGGRAFDPVFFSVPETHWHLNVKIKLKGHQKQITGLAFSQTLNALVSSGADAQANNILEKIYSIHVFCSYSACLYCFLLCIWNINGWEKRKSRSIQSPPGHPSSLVGETKVQFHNDQRHVLVVHESQIAIYDYQLECLRLWSPRESLSAPISSAIYSCDGLLLFTGFSDGAVGVFDADSLRLRCRIAPSAYISSSISSSNSTAYPVVIAAHPSDSNQFALGMSDGSVHVIEPADADPKWGGSAPQENGTLASSNPSNSAMNSQPSETPGQVWGTGRLEPWLGLCLMSHHTPLYPCCVSTVAPMTRPAPSPAPLPAQASGVTCDFWRRGHFMRLRTHR